MSAPQQVSTLSIAFIIASLILATGTPVGLAIWGKRKYRILFSFIPVFAGIVGFLGAQLAQVGLQWLIVQAGILPYLGNNPWLYTVTSVAITVLTAEFARFLIFAIMKERRDFADGLSYGIGHGGIEAIMGTALTMFMYYTCASSINAGTWSAYIAGLQDATAQESLTQTAQMLTTAAPADFLLYGIDTVCKILIQIALSLIVLKGFTENRKWKYLAVALGVHALVVFIATALQLLNVNQWVAEAVIILLAAAAVVYIVRAERGWNASGAPELLEGQPGQA